MSASERSRQRSTPPGSASEPTAVMPGVRPGGPSPGRPGRSPSDTTAQSAVTGGSAPAAEATARRTRRARLVLARVDPWSVMKLGFLLSVALAIVALTAVFVLWTVLDRMGAFDTAGRVIADVTEGESGGAFDLTDYVGLSRVLGVTAILACVNIVLMTGVATLSAFLYNIASSLVGGLHVTLSEDG